MEILSVKLKIDAFPSVAKIVNVSDDILLDEFVDEVVLKSANMEDIKLVVLVFESVRVRVCIYIF